MPYTIRGFQSIPTTTIIIIIITITDFDVSADAILGHQLCGLKPTNILTTTTIIIITTITITIVITITTSGS